MEKILSNLKTLAEKHQAKKLILFGSRARGDFRERSDIDIAVWGMEKEKECLFSSDVDDLPTLLKFDIVFVSEHTTPALLKNIEKDGVILYEQI